MPEHLPRIDIEHPLPDSERFCPHHGVELERFAEVTSDTSAPFTNDSVDTIVIATRHDSHADYVCRGLEAGKHVFLEKPIALTLTEADDLIATAVDVAAGRIPTTPYRIKKYRATVERTIGTKRGTGGSSGVEQGLSLVDSRLAIVRHEMDAKAGQ